MKRDMLRAAARAKSRLSDRAAAVERFVRSRCVKGGFAGRSGQADLYSSAEAKGWTSST